MVPIGVLEFFFPQTDPLVDAYPSYGRETLTASIARLSCVGCCREPLHKVTVYFFWEGYGTHNILILSLLHVHPT